MSQIVHCVKYTGGAHNSEQKKQNEGIKQYIQILTKQEGHSNI